MAHRLTDPRAARLYLIANALATISVLGAIWLCAISGRWVEVFGLACIGWVTLDNVVACWGALR